MIDAGDAASIASVGVATIALAFVGWQIREANTAASFAVCQHFITRLTDLWRDFDQLDEPSDIIDQTNALVGIFEHFELHALFLAEHKPAERIRQFITESIIDYIDAFAIEDFGKLVAAQLERPSVCCNLKKLCLSQRRNIANWPEVSAMLHIP